MSYYASIVTGSKTVLAAGPFNRHGDALKAVEPVRRLVRERGYRDHEWFGYGTCHHKAGRPTAKFTAEELGLAG